MGVTLADIAADLGCSIQGDPDVVVTHVATLTSAGEGALTFLANPRYKRYLAQTAASAVAVTSEDADQCETNALITANPYALYAQVAQRLHPPRIEPAGAHVSAVIDPSAKIGDGASVGANAVIEADAEIGARAVIGPGCVIGRGARIGADCRLAANVTVCHGIVIGERTVIHPGAVIGADGFGFARHPDGWIKVPQIGGVVIGDDVDIGAATTIDRGTLEDTVIANGVKIDNQIQIAHNVKIGEHTVIAACTGISGSTTIGKRCLIAGAVGFVGHLDICDDVTVTGQTMVNRSITQPGVYSSALPMDNAVQWRKNSARFRKLDELARSVKALERQQRDKSKPK